VNDFIFNNEFYSFLQKVYPLQTSSLWQQHGDVGAVSIVRSSAGRLLLEYPTARPFRSSAYYSKHQNGAFSSGF
jgi:hypothetical protein